jgi:hypothetical protein
VASMAVLYFGGQGNVVLRQVLSATLQQ